MTVEILRQLVPRTRHIHSFTHSFIRHNLVDLASPCLFFRQPESASVACVRRVLTAPLQTWGPACGPGDSPPSLPPRPHPPYSRLEATGVERGLCTDMCVTQSVSMASTPCGHTSCLLCPSFGKTHLFRSVWSRQKEVKWQENSNPCRVTLNSAPASVPPAGQIVTGLSKLSTSATRIVLPRQVFEASWVPEHHEQLNRQSEATSSRLPRSIWSRFCGSDWLLSPGHQNRGLPLTG